MQCGVAALTWPVGVAQAAAVCQSSSEIWQYNDGYIASWSQAWADSDDFWSAYYTLAWPLQTLGSSAESSDRCLRP